MKKLFVVLGLLLLSGCEEDPKVKNPETIDIGVFDGCTVKFIDRGHDMRNFYIARCGSTVTTTNNFQTTTNSGKTQTTTNHRETAITVDENAINKEIAAQKAKKLALSKLSDEEKKMLGLK